MIKEPIIRGTPIGQKMNRTMNPISRPTPPPIIIGSGAFFAVASASSLLIPFCAHVLQGSLANMGSPLPQDLQVSASICTISMQ